MLDPQYQFGSSLVAVAQESDVAKRRHEIPMNGIQN